ncbi:MAG: hypothetical protein HY059_22755 [Proteobacteria bacterium]|nr:hypothetical protein [Pseudomonadota bacterium]
MNATKRLLSLPLAALSFGSFLPLESPSLPPSLVERKSDLGDEGNSLVARRFETYRWTHPRGDCRAAGAGRRVLVTGFGPFSGAPYNVSGTVARSMADPAFWPDRVDLDRPAAAPSAAPTPGALSASDNGGLAASRTLVIDGQAYDVCFLTLDVLWDLAGAILIHEAAHFKPELILMTGRGNRVASFEAGALNKADRLNGYDSAGRPMGRGNLPQSDWLLEDYPVGHALAMTWDPAAAAEASRGEIAALGYLAEAQTGPRFSNDYLCNNLSFLALHAAEGRAASLADGRIKLDAPAFDARPVVGFLHFPAVDDSHPDLARYGAGIHGWARVIARTIKTALPSGN